MALTFYYGSGSPFAWRVWLALEYKGLAYEHKLLSFSAGDTRTPEFLALNPRHQVPVIVDDGFSLYESSAILEYLDDRFPTAPWLFPRDVRARARCRRTVREIDAYITSCNETLVQSVLFTKPESWDEDHINSAVKEYVVELSFWESAFDGEFLCGTLSAADFTLYPLVAMAERMEMRKPDIGLVAARGPRLRAWMERMRALPFFDKTYPPHWR